VQADGVHWPPGAEREALGRGLLDAVLAGDEEEGLIAALAEGLTQTAFEHPRRAALWEVLSSTGRAALLPRVAEALISRCNRGFAVSQPESLLCGAVLNSVRQTRPSARVLATLLRWNASISEADVIRWLDGPRASDWTPVAQALGEAVRVRGWARAAKAIYDHAWSASELRAAAVACQSLLSRWERYILLWWGKPSIAMEPDHAALVERVAEVGANLAPDGLDDLWKRAGGERKRLVLSGTPDVRWREAANLAQAGVLHGGLAALIHQLRTDFPHNADLQELARVIGDRH
jgi:hypothetical protein